MADLNATPTSTTSVSIPSVDYLPSTSSGLVREINIELSDLTINNQVVTSNIVNDPKISALRGVFSSLVITSIRLHVISKILITPEFTHISPAYFGLTAARNAGISSADAVELPYLSILPFSGVNMTTATSTLIPPGINMDLGAIALHAGHPIVILATDGGFRRTGTQGGEAPTDAHALVGGNIFVTLSCSGVGCGFGYDL